MSDPTQAMARPSGTLFRLADRAMAGTLADKLLEMDADGLSVDAISKRLFRDYDIDVSRTLVVTWLKALKVKAS